MAQTPGRDESGKIIPGYYVNTPEYKNPDGSPLKGNTDYNPGGSKAPVAPNPINEYTPSSGRPNDSYRGGSSAQLSTSMIPGTKVTTETLSQGLPNERYIGSSGTFGTGYTNYNVNGFNKNLYLDKDPKSVGLVTQSTILKSRLDYDANRQQNAGIDFFYPGTAYDRTIDRATTQAIRSGDIEKAINLQSKEGYVLKDITRVQGGSEAQFTKGISDVTTSNILVNVNEENVQVLKGSGLYGKNIDVNFITKDEKGKEVSNVRSLPVFEVDSFNPGSDVQNLTLTTSSSSLNTKDLFAPDKTQAELTREKAERQLDSNALFGGVSLVAKIGYTGKNILTPGKTFVELKDFVSNSNSGRQTLTGRTSLEEAVIKDLEKLEATKIKYGGGVKGGIASAYRSAYDSDALTIGLTRGVGTVYGVARAGVLARASTVQFGRFGVVGAEAGIGAVVAFPETIRIKNELKSGDLSRQIDAVTSTTANLILFGSGLKSAKPIVEKIGIPKSDQYSNFVGTQLSEETSVGGRKLGDLIKPMTPAELDAINAGKIGESKSFQTSSSKSSLLVKAQLEFKILFGKPVNIQTDAYRYGLSKGAKPEELRVVKFGKELYTFSSKPLDPVIKSNRVGLLTTKEVSRFEDPSTTISATSERVTPFAIEKPKVETALMTKGIPKSKSLQSILRDKSYEQIIKEANTRDYIIDFKEQPKKTGTRTLDDVVRAAEPRASTQIQMRPTQSQALLQEELSFNTLPGSTQLPGTLQLPKIESFSKMFAPKSISVSAVSNSQIQKELSSSISSSITKQTSKQDTTQSNLFKNIQSQGNVQTPISSQIFKQAQDQGSINIQKELSKQKSTNLLIPGLTKITGGGRIGFPDFDKASGSPPRSIMKLPVIKMPKNVYAASLTAFQFNIKAPKGFNTKKVFTGLETRPLLKGGRKSTASFFNIFKKKR